MIILDQKNRVFTLHTKSTTYQIKADQYGVLLHTYYGPRVGTADLSRLIQYADRGFSPNPGEAIDDRTYSLDTLPQEYSAGGAGDFRLPSIQAELADGSRIVDLRYTGFEVRPGKYALEGLPAFFAREGEAETLVLTLEDAASGLTVELYYAVFEQYDLITRSVQVFNRGSAPVSLLQAASLCLDLQRGDLDLLTFNGRHAMERNLSRAPLRPGVQGVGSVRGASSHQHNPFIMLCEQDAGEDHGLCWGAMLLYSGNFDASVERSQFENSRLVMGIHPRHFCWTLEPGQSFTTPEAAMVCSPSGFGEMSRQFHRAIRTHLLRAPRTKLHKPVLINSWEAAYFKFDADKLVSLAQEGAKLGVDLFVLDDGWFGIRNDDCSGLGDWEVNGEKLSGGLASLIGRVQALGMGFGIWIEPEMVNENSNLYRAHPDWVLTPADRPRSRGRSQLVLDFTRRDVRDYIYESLKPVFAQPGLSYVKWDMNRSLAEVWSPALPAGRQGEVYHRFVLGVYEFAERLRQDFPHLLIEGCCGGGGRFDGGMLYYTPQIWCSDNTDAMDRLRIQYGTSFCYPVCTMGAHVSKVPNEQTGRVTPLETRGTVAMSGTFGYEMDLGRTTPEEKKMIKEQVRFFKEHYDLIQQGNYYRLSDPFTAPYTAWEQVSPDKTEALVSLVYNSHQANGPFRTLRMKGLDPNAVYWINGGELWPGDVLMAAGYPLPLFMGDYQSIQLYLKAKS